MTDLWMVLEGTDYEGVEPVLVCETEKQAREDAKIRLAYVKPDYVAIVKFTVGVAFRTYETMEEIK